MTSISFAKSNIPNSGKDTAKLIDIIVNSVQEKKGHDLVCLDLRKSEGAICDFFIICHGNSTTQVRAIADFIDNEVDKKHGSKPWSKEGYENMQWVLLDYFDVGVDAATLSAHLACLLGGMWDGQIRYRVVHPLPHTPSPIRASGTSDNAVR